MPKPSKGPRLGSGPSHERLMLANMSVSLFEHKEIRTTVTRAKRLRPVAERLITLAKRGDLHARRQALAVLRNKPILHELFENIAPLVSDRPGGYTRIIKVGYRKGDNAPLAVIQLVLEPMNIRKAAGNAGVSAPADEQAVAADETVEEVTEAEVPAEEAEVAEAAETAEGPEGDAAAEAVAEAAEAATDAK